MNEAQQTQQQIDPIAQAAREAGAARNDFPAITRHQLDAIAQHMDDDIREALHSERDWSHPWEFLTAYMDRHPEFPIGQFGTTAERHSIDQIKDANTRAFAGACYDCNSIREPAFSLVDDTTGVIDSDQWSITPEQRREGIRAALLEMVEDQDRSLLMIDDGQELALVDAGELVEALEAGGWKQDGKHWIEPEQDGEPGDGREPHTLLCQGTTPVLCTGQGDDRDALVAIRDADAAPVFRFVPAEQPNGRAWRWD